MMKVFVEEPSTTPKPEHLDGCYYDPLPYFLVGDEIFPLKTWLVRPYPGKLTEEQRIFNYRLSRARIVIENTFGILVTRWRIYSRPIKASVENVEKYVLATISLHNYLQQTSNASYCPTGYVDVEGANGVIKEGEWRRLVREKSNGLQELPKVRGSRYREDAIEMRESLQRYLMVQLISN